MFLHLTQRSRISPQLKPIGPIPDTEVNGEPQQPWDSNGFQRDVVSSIRCWKRGSFRKGSKSESYLIQRAHS
jgi:hypothetical protein